VRLFVTPRYGASGERTVDPGVETVAEIALQTETLPAFSFVRKTDDASIRVDILQPNRVVYTWLPAGEEGGGDPLFGGSEVSEPVTNTIDLNISGQVAAAAVSTQGNQVYVGTDTGDLSWLRFDTEGGADGETTRLNLVEDGINALGFVFGDVSLVVA